jgi:NAD(P)-dependent dehydrogenase (short-subunit alcohol dehydrogenase family)
MVCSMKLKDKVALVTGGGRGIGKAVALAYAREGAKLAICARTAAEIEEARGEIEALGGEGFGVTCDVSLEESVREFIEKVGERFGKIDVLVNNAGVMTRPAAVAEFETAKWDYTIAVNLRGPFLVSKAVIPLMIRQRSGSIINVSSSIGRGAYANFSAYAASKWGLEGLTQTLAEELRPHRIRVNSIDPGYVATKITSYSGSRPDAVTEVFVFLAADESRSITGKMLSASGWKREIRT